MSKVTNTNKGRGILAVVRQALRKAPTLKRALQSSRALVHFGPWRHVARTIIRLRRPPRPGMATESVSLVEFDTTRIVDVLQTDGMAMAGTLPSEVLSSVCAITNKLPPGEYGNFHDVPDVRALVRCAATVDVARSYLRAEPELLECNLVVAHAENPNIAPKMGSQRQFHFDCAGWDSLSLFIYLTDVSQDSGAHEVVVGTHRTRKAWDAVRVAIPDNEIKERFPDSIRTITGPAGTMFFEDTSAFHRRKVHTRRRVMLNVLYASHRSWLSKGRLVVRYSDYLRGRDSRV
jgi:hypothetical protein